MEFRNKVEKNVSFNVLTKKQNLYAAISTQNVRELESEINSCTKEIAYD